jgi:hypothetical protein
MTGNARPRGLSSVIPKCKCGGVGNLLADSSFPRKNVIPAKAGIHLLPTGSLLSSYPEIDNMDSRFRGNDDSCPEHGFPLSPE